MSEMGGKADIELPPIIFHYRNQFSLTASPGKPAVGGVGVPPADRYRWRYGSSTTCSVEMGSKPKETGPGKSIAPIIKRTRPPRQPIEVVAALLPKAAATLTDRRVRYVPKDIRERGCNAYMPCVVFTVGEQRG